MTLAVAEAETILRARLGEPAKAPTQYVIGFSTPSGRVLAIERRLADTRIWFQPPAPPALDGVHLMSKPSNGNSNLNGPLLPLRAPTTLRVEVASASALNRFIDWYTDVDRPPRLGRPTSTTSPGSRPTEPADGREAAINMMYVAVLNTVSNANGQIIERTVKNKELKMSEEELAHLIRELLDQQDDHCALSGLPLQFLDPGADPALHPSVDRIDSNGHYELGNLQIVCRFVNFWKSDMDNEEFKRLLALVRGAPTD